MQTTKLLALASRGGGMSLRERALPVMQELLERTDENIHLSVRNDRGITIVEKLESSKVVRPHDPLGLVAPLHATSTGKAILAWSEPEVLDDVLAHGLEGFTARTLVDVDALHRELRAIREAGYSINLDKYRRYRAHAPARGLGRVRGGPNHLDIVKTDLPTAVVDESHVERPAGAPRPALDSGPVRPGQVAVPPLLERAEDDLQLPPGRRQEVGVAGAAALVAVGLPSHDPVLDEGGQPSGENVGRDAQRFTERPEPGRSHEGLTQDQEGPAFTQHTEAARDGAAGARQLRGCHAHIIPKLYFPTLPTKLEITTQTNRARE